MTWHGGSMVQRRSAIVHDRARVLAIGGVRSMQANAAPEDSTDIGTRSAVTQLPCRTSQCMATTWSARSGSGPLSCALGRMFEREHGSGSDCDFGSGR